ncbi:hypothetical protein CBR_g48400 [Chara braunii]|uniref:Integrase catalytic domain-containing protein n=1 Tax=Chara braunii TaxID=69332 RepID=A0A388M2U2_CHABU|nr:hypothetical protein CBR_g48400 [Chara braunii]|eukprot:GBG88783.1 hypothetical protein CBR_g48400 [Chara braunii]
MSDREETREDDRILQSAGRPIAHLALGPEGDRHLFRQQRERQQQQRRARAAEASRAFASEAATSAAMASATQQSSQASNSGFVGSTVAQTMSQSTSVMASQPIVLTPEEVAIQRAAIREAQLQQALGEIKAEKEKMIRRRARMQRRQADVNELEGMDLTHMDADVRTLRTVLLGVVEMQDHHTALLQDIQQSLALLVGRVQAAPSPSAPGAWPVVQPPPFVPPMTGVSPYVTPASTQAASLGMPLTGGFSAGPSVQVPVPTMFSQPPLQVVVSGQPVVSQPAQPQGTQPQHQLVQQPAPQGPQPGMVQVPGQTLWVPKTSIASPKPFSGDKRGEDLDTWLRPGESLSMDFMDTLVTSKSGMRYIYVIVDRFTGDKTRGGRSGEDRGGRVVGRWVTDGDKTRGNIGGEDGGDEVRGGEVAEAETGGAIIGETRRGDSAGGNAGMVMDAMEERTKTKGDKAAAVVTNAMEEHTETKGDTTAAVAPDAMEEHTETKGDTTAAGRVAPAKSIVEATKADEEEAANRKRAARVTNGMEGVTKTDEDEGAVDAGNGEEAVIGVTAADNEEGVVTGIVRGQCVDTRESG